MNLGILFALSAGLLYGILSLAYKYAAHVGARSAQFTFIMSVTAALITFAKSFSEQSTWGAPLLWITGAAMGLVIVAGVFVIMAANRLGPVYLGWTMVNVSFLFAIFLSAVILGEKLLCVDPLNLFLFGITLFLFTKGMRAGAGPQKQQQAVLLILALIGVFATNGLATFGSKLKYEFFAESNTSAYATVFYLVSALATLLIILVKRSGSFITSGEIKSGALGGLCMSTATILFLSAMSLPAAAVFTITQGVSLTSGVALTTIVGKEKLNKWMVFGLVMGAVVLLAVIFRDVTAAWICG
jgi:drug/metabolite transporter (DMT)-like permease